MKNKKTFIRILALLKPQMPLLILSILCAVLSVFTSLYIPVLTGDAIDEMIGAGQVSMTAIAYILRLFLIMVIVNSLSSFIMATINNHVAFKVVRDLRKRLFSKIHETGIGTLETMGQGDILSRIIPDVERLSDGLLLGFSEVFTGLLTIAATLIFMIRINLYVALVVIVLTPLSLFAASFISKKTYRHFKNQANLQGDLTTFINETVNGSKVIKVFGAETLELTKFRKKNEAYSKANLKALFYSSTTNPVTRFVNSLVYAAVGIFGGLLALNGAITIGTLTVFLSYASQYTKPFNEISSVIAEFQNAIACAGRIFEFLDKPEKKDSPLVPNQELKGEVTVKDLAFSYDKTKKLLYDISFKITPGSHVAIVGPTGCGKTTFINLILRFYDPDSGSIVLDNYDTKDLNKNYLRKNIGMVLQDTWLKEGTIKENIAYGYPDATMDEIVEAAKKAHAHSFIKRLEHGYDTLITQNGGNLSEGQKQLICIARLMLHTPPILILDEATSSIDTRTEIKINDAFQTLMEGRTCFIVAHRLSTIRNADLILVMKDGNIIEMGNHEELINKRGFYYELLNA